MRRQLSVWVFLLTTVIMWWPLASCDQTENPPGDAGDTLSVQPPYTPDELILGADLSYLNQILDRGGKFAGGEDPWSLFADLGVNVARFRLWHDPSWVRDLYQDQTLPLYSGLADVERAAQQAVEAGMDWCLDFHYSDNWADPGKQVPPAAWQGLEFKVLVDSVYAYTREIMARLKSRNLMPDYVQIGNEINTGMLHPAGHYEQNNWKNLGELVSAGIRAVREVAGQDSLPRVIIHIAQPENIRWFFSGLTVAGEVTDFDYIGVSYYPVWSQVSVSELKGYLQTAKNDFKKDILIMETAFPWTREGADDYHNIMGSADSLDQYPVSPQGQADFMTDLVQQVIDAGGSGVFYWEPGWISSSMITQWGEGSAWENCTFFDFYNNNSTLPVVDYLSKAYRFNSSYLP